MSEMVERVAKILCLTASGGRNDPNEMVDRQWISSEEPFVPRWRFYVVHARPVLEAIREPTPAMLSAGREEFYEHDLENGSEPMLKAVFAAMIDAALADDAGKSHP